jgi:PPOX class probable F420-dependent enzyme
MLLTPGQGRFLRERRFAVLTTVGTSGAPQATPVYYLYEDGRILISATKDRYKTRNIQREPRVAVCVLDEAPPFAYLQVRGRATVTEENLVETTSRIFRRFRSDLGEDFPQRLIQQKRVLLVVTPERATPDR